MPFSNARYSAAVSATFGVIKRSTTGSFARFRYMTTWSATPLSSKVLRKNSATSYFTPIAANTIANFSSLSPPREACFTICAASWSCGSPFPEKIGSFCPRIRVVKPSIAEIPVWIKFLGYSRLTGFNGRPLIFNFISGITGPRSSIGFPIPLKVRPRMSGDNSTSIGCPVNFVWVFKRDMFSVPSNTWMTALSS